MTRARSLVAEQILLAVAGLAIAACSSPQSSSSSGSASGPSGGGTTSDDPPWEDKIKGATDHGEMLTRDCYDKKTVWQGKPGAEPDPSVPPSASATPVTPTAGCPTIADLHALGFAQTSRPSDNTGSVVGEGPAEWQGQCCYLVSHWHMGRPLSTTEGAAVVAGVAARADWLAHGTAVRIDTALAAVWLRDARLEHASVASFARFAQDLLALGAPAALVEGALRAGLDEIDHAKRCFALASRFAGRSLGPSVLHVPPIDASRHDLAAVVAATISEGCVAETVAAMLAEAQLGSATDPEVRETLATIARDEARHATLAFQLVAWAVTRDARVVRFVDEAIAELEVTPSPSTIEDPRYLDGEIDEVSARARATVRAALRALVQKR
jgi:hypothetical protein